MVALPELSDTLSLPPSSATRSNPKDTMDREPRRTDVSTEGYSGVCAELRTYRDTVAQIRGQDSSRQIPTYQGI